MNILDTIDEFRSSPAIRERIAEYGVSKIFGEGDLILNENAYIKAIPIVARGSIKVMRTDEDGREILLYYINAGESGRRRN
jgi:CRP/FNR family transcriptional regulator